MKLYFLINLRKMKNWQRHPLQSTFAYETWLATTVCDRLFDTKINCNVKRKPWVVFLRVLYLVRIGIWRCWFLLREENVRTRRKTLEAWRGPTTNSIDVWLRAGIQPGPHWWEASALTTALSLLPKSDCQE